MGLLGKIRDFVPARYVLCLMLFFGFMVTFLLRVNLNMSVVAMVARPAAAAEASTGDARAPSTGGYCPRHAPPAPPAPPATTTTQRTLPPNASDAEVLSVASAAAGEFDWDEMQQGVILGSFFWGYLVFQVPGGRVAELYGAKRIFGGAILLNGFMSLVLPSAARLHWSLLLVIRAMQGLAQGVLFPSLNAAVSHWVPVAERAKFLSFTVCGASLGTVISMPLCGAILSSWGWEAVFYVSGILALTWSGAWWLLVYETPDQHPRISPKERQYLASCISTHRDKTYPVPWKAVFTSWQFWLGCIAAWGSDWGFHTFLTLGPKYIKEALDFDLEQSSWLASLPFLCQYAFAIIYGIIADELLKKGYRVLVVRRVSTIISHGGPALLVVILAFVGCNVTASIAILTTAVSLIGAFSAGFFQNPLDVAPNFAGSLTGIMNGIGSMTGVISPPLAGVILHNMGLSGWPVIFCIAAAMYLLSCLPYVLFVTAKVQPWNNVQSTSNEKHAELPMISHCPQNENGEEHSPENEKINPNVV
ncbi:hypothetical protein R5R35_006036 [Gryllus longicercus]|uniref:Major facilitator superfamily (MFS) profile domain-containing protein n=1 Tax=Gryllus longicercus TaxID=2509291 RepID=A0AAN9VR43_9ORTH